MSEIHLTGQLVCRTAAEAEVVRVHLREHIERTRAEPGCLSFTVTPSADTLRWDVEERFENQHVFELHQERASASTWGRATSGIERRYSVTGLAR